MPASRPPWNPFEQVLRFLEAQFVSGGGQNEAFVLTLYPVLRPVYDDWCHDEREPETLTEDHMKEVLTKLNFPIAEVAQIPNGQSSELEEITWGIVGAVPKTVAENITFRPMDIPWGHIAFLDLPRRR